MIYLQEIAAVTYLTKIPENARSKVLMIAAQFPSLLDMVCYWKKIGIPAHLWWSFFAAR